MMDDCDFFFNKDKSQQLKQQRGIGFEEIIALIENGHLMASYPHPDRKRYPAQHMFEVELKGYIYLVPYIQQEGSVFLKTIYPSRKATKRRKEKDNG